MGDGGTIGRREHQTFDPSGLPYCRRGQTDLTKLGRLGSVDREHSLMAFRIGNRSAISPTVREDLNALIGGDGERSREGQHIHHGHDPSSRANALSTRRPPVEASTETVLGVRADHGRILAPGILLRNPLVGGRCLPSIRTGGPA
jgi:hypothetical protein